MTKENLRKIMKDELLSLSNMEYITNEILNLLEENINFIKSKKILLYYSLPDEINTHKFIKKIDKEIYLPCIMGEDIFIKKYTGHLVKGSYNILEPIGDIYHGQIDLAIVPGMAFDNNGNRLGRGKGYYDRLLSKLSCYNIGICFPCQLIDYIPNDKWDIKMNEVITFKNND